MSACRKAGRVLFPSLEPSHLATVGGGEKGRLGRRRRAFGPFRLRWPAGRLEVVGTAVALPVGVGCSGPSRSRGSCPCAAGEATAAAALLWNKSSRSLPRPVGVPLRRHRRARRGGAPRVERLYRSPASFVLRLRRAVEVRGFCSWATEQAGVLVGVWRLDLPRSFLGGGGRRRRRQIQGLQGLGQRSDRQTTGNGFCYCDSNQSHGPMARRGRCSSRWSSSSLAAVMVAAGVGIDSWWIAKDLGTWV